MSIPPRTFVTLTNRLGLFAILALIYWVFAFILMTVFELRIFRENLTEIFFLSVAGILALMVGSLILNIMFNLTRIANSSESLNLTSTISLDTTNSNQTTMAVNNPKDSSIKKIFAGLLLLFPLITGGLFWGDYLNTQKKYEVMTQDASHLLSSANVSTLSSTLSQAVEKSNNTLPMEDLRQAFEILQTLETQSNQEIQFILPYQMATKIIDNDASFLAFDTANLLNHTHNANDHEQKEVMRDGHIEIITIKTADVADVAKAKFTRTFDDLKTEYLTQVFAGQTHEIYFEAHDGNFEMLYPYFKDGKLLGVYYFSDYMRYGKYGS